LLTSMYTLPWYDLTAWIALAMVAASQLDRLMVVRTAVLSLGYVPGRDRRAIQDYLPESLDFVSTRMRDTVCPIVEAALLVLLIVWARRRGARWWPYEWPRRLTGAGRDNDHQVART
jgi:alpha-1,6-mannosyltransferase